MRGVANGGGGAPATLEPVAAGERRQGTGREGADARMHLRRARCPGRAIGGEQNAVALGSPGSTARASWFRARRCLLGDGRDTRLRERWGASREYYIPGERRACTGAGAVAGEWRACERGALRNPRRAEFSWGCAIPALSSGGLASSSAYFWHLGPSRVFDSTVGLHLALA
jgi:hypothetical protein